MRRRAGADIRTLAAQCDICVFGTHSQCGNCNSDIIIMKHSDQLVFLIFSVSLLNSVQCQSGDDTLETSGDATIIENNDDDEGSGGSALETVTVEHTVSYSMSGSNGFEIR